MPALTARDLIAIRTYGAPALAPSGDWIALVEQGIDPDQNRNTTRIVRWSVTRPDTTPTPLTRGPSDDKPAFAPDGRALAFLSRRGEPFRQIYLLPLDGGEAVRLTDLDGGVRDFAWLADGSGLVFIASLEDDRLVPQPDPDATESDPFVRYNRDVKVIERMYYRLDGEGYFGRRRSALCHLDLKSRQVRLLAGGPFDHKLAYVEGDGAATVVIANRGADPDRELPVKDLWRVPHDGSGPQRLTDLGLGVEEALATASGERYVLASLPSECGYAQRHLFRVTPDGRAAEDLTGRERGCFGEETAADIGMPASPVMFVGPDDRPWGSWSEAGRVGLARLDADDRIVQVLGGDRGLGGVVCLPDGRFAVCAGDPLHPGYVSLETAQATIARHEATPDWESSFVGSLSRPEGYTVHAPDGPAVDAWYMPPTSDATRDADGRHAAVLEVHGGPSGMYGYRFHFEFQLLCARGFGVAFSNPRGSTGYGDAFCKDIMADWGNHDYQDVIACMDGALARHPEIDPARTGVAGGSYGGFMVNWIVGHTDRFAAAVTMRSVVNRLSTMGTSDMGYLRTRQFGTGPWWESIEPYLHQSPLMWASNIRTPLLIEHQEGDLRCPIEQGEQLYMALKFLGREVRFVRYPDEFHGMSRGGKPWHRVHRLLEIERWFGGHLGAVAQSEAAR